MHKKQLRLREREAAATERERKRLYVEDRKAEAADLTAAVVEQVTDLESVLRDGLTHTPDVSFEGLKLEFEDPPFDAGGLDQPLPAPEWEGPTPPSLFGRLVGRGAQYRRELDTSRQENEQACARHAAEEAERKRNYVARRRLHRQTVAEERRRHETRVDQFAAAVEAGEQDAIEDFFTQVLDTSPYPEGFSQLARVIYLPHARDLVIEFELPPQQIIPVDHDDRYVQSRDEIDPIARPTKEIKARYGQLIAQVALRTIHEVFRADDVLVVDTVTFVGLVSTVDKATGQPIRPSSLSVSVDRERFSELVLAEVDPVTCLRHLNALVSPHPYDLEPVTPIVDFEALLKQYRFVEGIDAPCHTGQPAGPVDPDSARVRALHSSALREDGHESVEHRRVQGRRRGRRSHE
jgi:restriction system protein